MSYKKTLSAIREEVEQRAHFRCEYCRTTVKVSTQKFEIEHIIPIALEGTRQLENLALSCRGCNAHKHARIVGFDEITQSYTPLFHPRNDNWAEHFAWDQNPLYLIGLTTKGRATISTLKLNRSQLISVRELLQRLHMHPPH